MLGAGIQYFGHVRSQVTWKARNDAVFNTPRANRAFLLAHEEAILWMLAGAKGLSGVVATRLPEQ
jgi:hypothetical protein